MSVFSYFIADVSLDQLAPGNELSAELLDRLGLSEVLADCRRQPEEIVVSPCAKGPAGRPGFVLTPMPTGRELTESVQFRPQKQTWAEVEGPHGSHWIGWQTDAPPGPADLARRKQISGHAVEGSSGRGWTIPIARSGTRADAMPRNIVFEGGNPTAKIKPAFEPLWEMSGQVWDFVFGDEKLSDAASIGIVMTAIRTNYRIGPAEITALHTAGAALLDTDFSMAALYALIDIDLVEEVQKKTNEANSPPAPSTSKSTPGDAA